MSYKTVHAATGDGNTKQFEFTIPSLTGIATDLPAKGTLVLRAGPDLNAFDNKEGRIIGAVAPDEISTINYTTGAVNVTFIQAPADDQKIEAIFTAASQTVTLPDYTVLSFEGLLALIVQLVRDKDSWKDLYESNQGMVLAEMVAYAASRINYMIMRRSQESYIKTARLRSSLIRLVDLLSYRVRRKTGATTTLRFKAPVTYTHTYLTAAPGSSETDYTGTLPKIPLSPGTVNITVEATGDVIVDDGAGNLTAEAGVLDGGGNNSVNYTTGAYDFTLAAGADSALTIAYTSTKATPTITDQVLVPKYTKVRSSSGIPFITTEDAIIDPFLAADPGRTYVEVPALQGEWATENYVLPETVPSGYELSIGDDSIEDDGSSIVVYTGREEFSDADIETANSRWTEVESFIESRSDSRHFRVLYGLDSSIKLRFGDGFFGMIPPGTLPGDSSAIVRVKTIRTKGKAGNISAINDITRIISTFTDSSLLTVTNVTTASGGDDAQSTEEIRTQGPAVFRTGDRAVTREDFITILKDLPGVKLANAWGEHENDPPNIEWFNRVEFAVVMNSDPNPEVPLDWANPSATELAEITEALEAKKVITTYLTTETVVEVMLILSATIFVDTAYNLVEVKRSVQDALSLAFDVGNKDLGESIYLSNLIEIVEAVDGVHHVDIAMEEPYASNTYELDTDAVAGTNVTGTIPDTPIAKGTVVIRYGNNVITDDGSGNLIGAVDGEVVATIDYDTGDVDFTIPSTSDIGTDATSVEAFYKARLYSDPVTQNVAPPGSAITNYTGSLTTTPVRPGTVMFEVVATGDQIIDSGGGLLKAADGVLDETADNTLDYATGAFDFTLIGAVDSALDITYNSYLSKPSTVEAPSTGNLFVRRHEFVTFDPNFDLNLSGINYKLAS